ncbi:MAG: tRNA pseudouridine(38-40) synthase TruA [Chloroflexota bacterium]
MRQFKAVIAYDGTDFLGFQVQANGRTVQGTIEIVLASIAKSPVRIVGAGRTDTGVHAAGQVVSFRLNWQHDTSVLKKVLNVKLPNDIVVLSLVEMKGDFHPRYDAKSRQYRYTIRNQSARSVFDRHYSLLVTKELDLRAIKCASRYFLGTHDFATFGRPPQGTNSVRTIFKADWYTNDMVICFEITADAFLYRMVRNIVGTLLDVGLRKISAGDIPIILLAKDRAMSGSPVAPNGLSLIKINY